MSPATTKTCTLCGQGFRGTTTPEEVHCAKCFVKTCDVPEDTDEQFMKLVSEIHGPELASESTGTLSTAAIIPMMKDILNHKARLSKLKSDVEQSNKSTKEKNRMKREIYRLREEKEGMETLLEGIKAKMIHLAFMSNAHIQSPTSQSPKSKPATDHLVKASPIKQKSPVTPIIPKVPNNTPESITPSSPNPKSAKPVETCNIPGAQVSATPSSPPRSPSKQTPQQPTLITPTSTTATTKPPNASPVKLTALKFEAAAKKVNNVVTFAKPLSKTKPNRAPEVNNNDTPVTASSSSGEEDDEYDDQLENGKGDSSALKRSNSVRDRIKAFEEIQRRASTGSYDRKKSQQAAKAQRALSSMKSINV